MAEAKTRRKGAKTVARSYFKAIAEHDLDAMEAHWHPGGRGHLHGIAELETPGNYRGWFGNLFAAFPDLEMEVLDAIGSGELAAVRWRARGTFTGQARFEGLVANGSRVEIEGCDMITVRDGTIHEIHAYTNGAELGRQLGALPPGGSLAERGMTVALNARTATAAGLRRLRERR